MTLSGIYLALSIIVLLAVASALVKARRLYYFAPVYFFTAWLTGELALIHLLWQLVFTLLVGIRGGLDNPAGQWGMQLFALSWLGLLYLHFQSTGSGTVLNNALIQALGDNYTRDIPTDRQDTLSSDIATASWLRPFHMRREGVTVHKDISYAEHGRRNLLDIYQPDTPRTGGFPVLLQVHGGGWMISNKNQQGLPLMYHMAQRGWLCVACNYRLSPAHRFPDHIIDVKRAIAWIRQHAGEFGGDPEFIAITGGSAGGHLAALAALTPNHKGWQPGFERADTALAAAVPFYGVYDFLDRKNIRGAMSMEPFLSRYVMPQSTRQNLQLWQDASPVSHVSRTSPPLFVIQGSHDSLVWAEEAHSFVDSLRNVSEQPVAYAELPGAQHAFDVFHSVRTEHTLNAVSNFLEWCHAQRPSADQKHQNP